MSGKIHVASIDSLARLEAILGEFAEKTSETVDSFGRNVERRLEGMEEHCEELEREAEYWDDLYETADEEEDDIGYLAYKRDEAQEKLHRARRIQQRVGESAENFARAARRVQAISSEHLAEARAFLEGKIRELQEYTAFRMENMAFGEVSSGGILGNIIDTASEVMGSTLKAGEEIIENLTDIVLPKGFKWVPLDEINPQEMSELPTESDFRKGVTPDDMKRGFEILRRDILPVLKQSPEKANAEYFEKFDIENNRDLANSTRKIFNIFFGQASPEYIRLERFIGGFYGITNGRHRIKTARDLGWTVIPAEAIDVDLNKHK